MATQKLNGVNKASVQSGSPSHTRSPHAALAREAMRQELGGGGPHHHERMMMMMKGLKRRRRRV